MRVFLVVVLCISTAAVGMAQTASHGGRASVHIQPQQLATALKAFSKASGLHVVYLSEDVQSQRTHGASGSLTNDEALADLLVGTGLTYRYLDKNTVTIMPRNNSAVRSKPVRKDGTGSAEQPPQPRSESSPRSPFRLAQGNPTPPGENTSVKNGQEPSSAALQEVVVSSTKLQQPARKLAASISIVSDAQLEAVGAQSFEDYLTLVPGVVFNAGPPGLSTAVIRGVSTTNALDQGQGTTGYYINGVPLTDPNFAVAIPDIDTFDVDNVAVMRGPQGTLFGSASLGGAINYQAALPDLSEFHAHVQGTFAGTSDGAPSDSGKVMLNFPLISDRLALRTVYIYRDDGGYIDNIGTGVRNSDRTLVRGGRAELLWRPADGTKVSYLFLRQLEDTADNGYQEPALAGPLEKKTLIPEPLDFKTTLNSLRVDQELGLGVLTVMGTYHQKSEYADTDLTAVVGGLFGNQLSPISGQQYAQSNGTTFEMRLTSPSDQRFTYVVGAMRDLTRESFLDLTGAPGAEQYATTVFDPLFGAGFGTQAVPNNIFITSTLGAKGDERALFGEGTFHFNQQWALTLGGRLFDTQITGDTSTAGLLEYLLTSPSVLNFAYSSRERSRGFTPKASLTWTITPDMMVYALASKGFRFGGPNLNPPDPKDPFPPTYSPDSLWNYELGTRTDWLDRRLQLDVTAFYIDWSNIQVRLSTADGLAYATNFGRATNYGLENSLLWHATSALTLQASATYLSATLKQAVMFGETAVPASSVLPGASKWNVSGTAEYRMNRLPLHPAIVLSDRFIATAPGDFGQVAPTTQFGYNLLDVRVNAYLEDVQATLFLNNATDKRGVTYASYNLGSPLEQDIVRPRTVGLTLDYQY